jgi:hypothetical protein
MMPLSEMPVCLASGVRRAIWRQHENTAAIDRAPHPVLDVRRAAVHVRSEPYSTEHDVHGKPRQ